MKRILTSLFIVLLISLISYISIEGLQPSATYFKEEAEKYVLPVTSHSPAYIITFAFGFNEDQGLVFFLLHDFIQQFDQPSKKKVNKDIL